MDYKIKKNAQHWENLVKDVKGLESGEERILIIGGRAVLLRKAQVDDLDRVNRGAICID